MDRQVALLRRQRAFGHFRPGLCNCQTIDGHLFPFPMEAELETVRQEVLEPQHVLLSRRPGLAGFDRNDFVPLRIDPCGSAGYQCGRKFVRLCDALFQRLVEGCPLTRVNETKPPRARLDRARFYRRDLELRRSWNDAL